jgi:hypothetical protein
MCERLSLLVVVPPIGLQPYGCRLRLTVPAHNTRSGLLAYSRMRYSFDLAERDFTD